LSVTTDVIGDGKVFSSLADEWNALASRFRSPLLRHEWFAACAAAFCPPGRLNVMVTRSADGILAIAPLVVESEFGTKRLEILGTSVLGELSGFIYRDEDALEHLIRTITATGQPILFRCLPSESPELRMLKNTHPARWVYEKTVHFASPWVPIASCWEDFHKSISSSWRSSLRRSRRRAEEMGNVDFEILSPTLDTLETYLGEMVTVESSGWKSRTGTAVLVNAGLNRFFQEYAKAAARLGMLRFAFLRVNGKAIASQLLVDYGGRLWILKVGYDEDYARCSPGILLMHHVVQHAFEQHYEAFELLGANEPWVNIWKPQLHKHELYRRYPLTPLPVISHGLETADSTLGRLRTIMRKEGGGIPWRLLIGKLTHRTHRAQA
jgi:CelD/BcsL family acetyltransferase involved in cellulose biosynthesis